MRTPRDYLGLELVEARRQWRSIVERRSVAKGERQVDFVPVETLLCLAASLLVNHRHYGGSTSDRAEEPVPSLARLFRRPNSSVLAKMANLDGSRRNGAKCEVEVAARLLSSTGELTTLYRLALRSARDVGIDESRLPDFLRLAYGDDLCLLGQEELSEPEMERAVQKDVARWRDTCPGFDEAVTERLLVATARVGQHRFATAVLDNYGHQCGFCGLSVTLAGARAARMLVACPTHDVAFDTGLMTVDGGLCIHLEPGLHLRAGSDPATHAAFGKPPLGDRLTLADGGTLPGRKYLAWHHSHVYRAKLDV